MNDAAVDWDDVDESDVVLPAPSQADTLELIINVFELVQQQQCLIEELGFGYTARHSSQHRSKSTH